MNIECYQTLNIQKMVDDWFPIKLNEHEGLCDDEEKRVHIQACYKPAGVSY